MAAPATLSFANTLLANNAAPLGTNCYELPLAPVTWQSLGYNLEDDDTCPFDQLSDQIYTGPLLGPLQDNGGPTWTHALLDVSPAIDAANNTVCAAPP